MITGFDQIVLFVSKTNIRFISCSIWWRNNVKVGASPFLSSPIHSIPLSFPQSIPLISMSG